MLKYFNWVPIVIFSTWIFDLAYVFSRNFARKNGWTKSKAQICKCQKQLNWNDLLEFVVIYLNQKEKKVTYNIIINFVRLASCATNFSSDNFCVSFCLYEIHKMININFISSNKIPNCIQFSFSNRKLHIITTTTSQPTKQ